MTLPAIAPPQGSSPPGAPGGVGPGSGGTRDGESNPFGDGHRVDGGEGGGGGTEHPSALVAPEPSSIVMTLTAVGILGAAYRFRRGRARAVPR